MTYPPAPSVKGGGVESEHAARPCVLLPLPFRKGGWGGRFVVLIALLLASCGGNNGSRASRSPSPQPSVTATSAISGAASPTAAGIAGTPRVAAATPAASSGGAAEAALRRVAIFATDLPPRMSSLPPVMEGVDATAQRVPDPAGFRDRAAQHGRVATYFTAFGAMPPAGTTPAPDVPRAAASGAAWYTSATGAQAEFDALRSGGMDAVRTAGLIPPMVPVDITAANPGPSPSVGDEALAWNVTATQGADQTSGTLIAFRRGKIIVTVLLLGEGDAAALAQRLDTRAKDAQG